MGNRKELLDLVTTKQRNVAKMVNSSTEVNDATKRMVAFASQNIFDILAEFARKMPED